MRYWIAKYEDNVRSISANSQEEALYKARLAKKATDGMLISVEEVSEEEDNVYDETR